MAPVALRNICGHRHRRGLSTEGNTYGQRPAAMLQQALSGAGGSLDLSKPPGHAAAHPRPHPAERRTAGAARRLQSNGLGDQVSSCLDRAEPRRRPQPDHPGPGPGPVKAAAEKAASRRRSLAGTLSQTLPGMVDKALPLGFAAGCRSTVRPDRKAPGGDQISGLLGQLLGGVTGGGASGARLLAATRHRAPDDT